MNHSNLNLCMPSYQLLHSTQIDRPSWPWTASPEAGPRSISLASDAIGQSSGPAYSARCHSRARTTRVRTIPREARLDAGQYPRYDPFLGPWRALSPDQGRLKW
jgi:hypothetical protein